MALRFARLDRPSIRRLKPGEKITEHGITAERLRDGDLRYSVNVMVDGERIHRVVGYEIDGTTRTQCENFIAKVRQDAKENRLDLPRGRKIHLTFTAAAERYLSLERETGGKDMASKERHLKLHLVPYFGNMRIDRISKFTVEKFRNELRRKGMAEGGIVRVLATFRHMGNRLSGQEPPVIPAPFKMPTIGVVENRREFVLDAEEERALLAAALEDSNTYVWLFIKIGLSTSMRHTEILSARFDNLDSTRRRIEVRVKGGKRRAQPLSRGMTEILLRERDMAADPDGWIFPNPKSASGHCDSMKKPFRRCVVRARLDPTKVSPHTLRHTSITAFAETGADVKTIQRFSGHTTERMVMRYTHARDERVDDALERMERAKTEPEQISGRKTDNS